MNNCHTSPSTQWLLCDIQGQSYALDVQQVLELLSLRDIHITPIPQTPAYVEGVISIRGKTLVILDFRTMLGMQSMRQDTAEILQLLHDREQDHVNWLNELYASVRESREFQLATDPHRCKFGVWYDALMSDEEALSRFTNDQLSLLDLMSNFDRPHQQIHKVAIQVGELVAQGAVEEAVKLIDKARDTALRELLDLFGKAREMVATLRRGVVIVVEFEGKRFGLLFDGASDLHDFSHGTRQSSEVVGDDSPVGDFLHDEATGILVQIIELGNIANQHRTRQIAPESELAADADVPVSEQLESVAL
ncbi:MAG: chemotaxis protein CheW [Planctomycetales bacterium]|nr:chemotaxis protein CheW [Planctomycetales bacterium]